MKKTLILGSVVPLIMILGGCATPVVLQNYPERQIDRPYTLPQSLNAYGVAASLNYAQDNNSSGAQGFLNPFIFQHGISDSLNYVFPLSLQYQFIHTAVQTFGVTAGISSFGFGNGSGLWGAPQASSYYRFNWADQSALEVSLDYSPSVYDGNSYEGSSWGADIGVPFQLSDNFVITPQIDSQWENGYSDYNGNHSYIIGATSFLMPVGLIGHLNLSRRWEIYGTYFYSAIGATNGYTDHAVSAKAVFFF